MWSTVGNIFGGSAASSAGGSIPWKGLSLTGDQTSPSHKVFGNFFTQQDEYEDKRQYGQQLRLNDLALRNQLQLERLSFEQRMAMAKEQGLHPLSVLGVSMSSPVVSGASSHDYSPSPGSGMSLDAGKHSAPSEYDNRMMEYNERIASANARAAEARAAQEDLQLRRDSTTAVGRPGVVSNDQIQIQSKLSGVPASRIRYGGNVSGDTALISIKPDEVTASRPGNPGMAAGVPPGFREVATPDGKKLIVPDQSVIQTEIDEGALYNSLINHGVSPGTALDIVGIKDLVITGLAGVAGAGALGWKYYKARQAAELARKAKAHRRWKGGE